MVIETFQKKLSHLFVNLNVDSDSSSNDSLSSSLSGGQSVRDVSRKLDGSSTRRTTEEFEAERKKKIDFTARLIAGGLGSGIAETVTLPTDVVKVRMQISHNINPSASASASPGPPAAGKKTPPPPNKKTPSIRSFSSFSSAKSTFFSDHCTTTRLNNSFRTGGSNYNINNIVGIGRNSFPFSFNYRRLFGSGSGGLNPPPIPPPQQKHYTSVLDCTSQLVRNEGVMALWKGYTAALARQVSYSSVMMVLYEPIRNLLCCGSISPDPNNTLKPNFLQRLFSGGVAGGVGIAIFNPFEVVKTQIQNSPTRLTMRSVAQKVNYDYYYNILLLFNNNYNYNNNYSINHKEREREERKSFTTKTKRSWLATECGVFGRG